VLSVSSFSLGKSKGSEGQRLEKARRDVLVEIRRMRYDDIPIAASVAHAAFQTRGSSSSSRADDLRRYLLLQPDGWLVAEENGRIVGTAGMFDYGLFAWVGSMAVLPEMQGQGIGRKLLERILEWLDARGCPLVRLDATPAGQRLYPHLGFVEASRTFEYAQSPQRPIGCDWGCVHPMEGSELEEVIQFDEEIFGARREKLLRLFWAHYDGRSFVSLNDQGKVSGYLFAQAKRIGPWMAMTPRYAKALLGAASTLHYEDESRIIVPAENQQAGLLLEEARYVLRLTHSHMRRGKGELPGMRQYIWGQASHALG
jgi:GNAT superfamily N-acetyltransferase